LESLNEPIDDATRPSLLWRVRDPGDAQSWSDFVDIYGPLIYSYCRRNHLQESDAADVSQEVMLRVSKALRRFEYNPERGSFRHWLGRVTRNEVSRFFRTRGRIRESASGLEGAVELDGVAGEDEWNDHFQSALLEAAIRRIESTFEPQPWSAFLAVWVDDLSPNQAAQKLDMSIDNVYVAKSRVLKRLREELLALCEDVPHAHRMN
jgi:RNA polymerase sigma-70 factor (ECF subfamily)